MIPAIEVVMTKNRYKIIIIFLSFLFGIFENSLATNMNIIPKLDTPDTQYRFAMSLMNDGDYYRAIGEFKRYLFLYPDGNLADSAMINIGNSMFGAGRYQNVIDWHNKHIVSYNKSFPGSGLLLGRAYFRLGKYHHAIDVLLGESRDRTDSAEKDEHLFLAGLAAVRMQQYARAQSLFEQVCTPNARMDRAQYYAELLSDNKRYSQKSRIAAGMLSLAPGLGYAYCGYYRTALSSLIANGLLFWAASSAFENENYGAGGFISMVLIGFYAGNIYGSITTADRFNESRIITYQEQFQE